MPILGKENCGKVLVEKLAEIFGKLNRRKVFVDNIGKTECWKLIRAKMKNINRNKLLTEKKNRNKVCPKRTKHWLNRTKLWLD